MIQSINIYEGVAKIGTPALWLIFGIIHLFLTTAKKQKIFR